MSMSKEMMAQKVIPFLMPLSVENSLTLNQFNTLISVVKEMVTRVETEHRAKLEQLTDQTQALESSLPTSMLKPQKPVPVTEDLFSFSSPAKTTNSVAKLPTESFTTTLTLQEKERIVNLSESEKRVQSLSVLDPKPVTSIGPQPVKDLTSTLFNSSKFELGSAKPSIQNGTGPTNSLFPTIPHASGMMMLNQAVRPPPMMGNHQNGSGMATDWSKWNTSNWSTPLLPNQQQIQKQPKPLSPAEINDLLS